MSMSGDRLIVEAWSMITHHDVDIVEYTNGYASIYYYIPESYFNDIIIEDEKWVFLHRSKDVIAAKRWIDRNKNNIATIVKNKGV